MQKEEEGHCGGSRLCLAWAENPQGQHGDEDRGFHKHPSQAVAHGGAPPAVVHHAVAGRDALQGKENGHGQAGHGGYDAPVYVGIEQVVHIRLSDGLLWPSIMRIYGKGSHFSRNRQIKCLFSSKLW
jgi:hypothetical protein